MNELEKEKTKEYSMLWWNFNKYVRFPLGILSSLGNISYYSELEFNTLVSLLFVVDIVVILLLCATYYHFLERNEIGYKLLNALLIVELLTNAVSTTMKKGIFVATDFILYTTILGLVWTLPNYIYFRKRKCLFSDKEIKKDDPKYKNDKYVDYEAEKKNDEILNLLINNLGETPNTEINKKIEQKDIENKTKATILIEEELDTKIIDSDISENIVKESNETNYKASNNIISNNPWKVSTIILGILIAILICVSIYTASRISLLEEEISCLNSDVDYYKNCYKNIQEKYSECSSEKYKLEKKADFFDRNAVIVPANTRVYHRYDCTYCDKSSFYILNDKSAISQGFKPCSHCIE